MSITTLRRALRHWRARRRLARLHAGPPAPGGKTAAECRAEADCWRQLDNPFLAGLFAGIADQLDRHTDQTNNQGSTR